MEEKSCFWETECAGLAVRTQDREQDVKVKTVSLIVLTGYAALTVVIWVVSSGQGEKVKL